MYEERVEVVQVMVILRCECGGEMSACSGVALMTNPPQHPHVCNKCGVKSHVAGGNIYPYIKYEEKK